MELPSFKTILKFTGWNLVGMCAPILVALAAFPVLAHQLGEEKLGALSLIWMLVGYFSVFDLGLSRALTKLIAEKLGRDQEDEVPGLFWTALVTMTLLGGLGAVAMYWVAPWLAFDFLNASELLRDDILHSFRWVCVALPVIISIMGLVGTLEAYQHFKILNLLRIPLSSFTFLGPLLVLPFTKDLVVVVMVLVLGRLMEWVCYFTLCMKRMPQLRKPRWIKMNTVAHLLRFGGWMTVSNLILPLMYHIDRFLIGRFIAVFNVAYYITASEVIIKMMTLSRALVTVLFPSFSAHIHVHPAETRALYLQSMKALLSVMFVMVVMIMALAETGLDLWLGADYAAHSTAVMQWLAVGILFSSLSYIPYSFIQGAGKPAVTALIHVVELIIYIGLSIMLIHKNGIAGAAQAWCIRAVGDTLIMTAAANRIVKTSWIRLIGFWLMLLLALILALPMIWINSQGLRLAWMVIAIILFGIVIVVSLGREDRKLLVGRLTSVIHKLNRT